jgi:hypothetical protein
MNKSLSLTPTLQFQFHFQFFAQNRINTRSETSLLQRFRNFFTIQLHSDREKEWKCICVRVKQIAFVVEQKKREFTGFFFHCGKYS